MFKLYSSIFLLLFCLKANGQFISLETCNESISIAARSACFQSYLESVLITAFKENKSKINLGNKTDKLSLEVLVDEDGNFKIVELAVENVGLYKVTQSVIENLLPISPYKNYEGISIYDTFSLEIDFPLNKTTSLVNSETYTLLNVEQSPVFPGCFTENNKGLKSCMSASIKTHIANNFNVFLKPNSKIKKGNQRINIQFTINKLGFIDNIKTKAKYKELEEEAYRVIKLLPKMTPGKVDNNPVNVKILLPITFHLS